MTRFFSCAFFIFLTIILNTKFAYADDLALTGSNSFTGAVGVAMPITDLQISGTTPSTTPVKLLVSNGTLAMSTTTGLTFTGPSTGSTLYFSGTLTNINAALSTLTYTRGSVGSDTLEVSLVNSGEVFFSGNNHLYKFISGSITWNGAQAAAPSQTAYGVNGYLATITSQQENDFVATRLVGDGWFGASDSVAEGNWKWVAGPENGTQFWSGAGGGNTVGGNYANWASGEPNDSSGNEDCAQFYISTGKWNDLPCSGSTLSGYVAEFGAPGNLPTVVAKNISITTSSDITPPTIPGTPSTTTPTNSTGPTWTWTASTDAGSGMSVYVLKWSTSSDCNGGSNTTTGSNSYTIPEGLMTEGTWYFCVAARDNNSNTSSYSSAGSVVVDTTAPTVPGTPTTATPTNVGHPTWTWTASTETGSGLERYLLKWSQNSDCSAGYTTTTGGTSYSIPSILPLSEGTWYFCVAARDNAQNDSAYSAGGSVLIDTTAPILTQVTQLPNTSRQQSAVYYFSTNEEGSYTIDNCGGQAQSSVSPGMSVSLSGLTAGTTYSCGLRVTDPAGNISNTLNIGPITIYAGGTIPLPILQKMSALTQVQNPTITETKVGEPSEQFLFKIDMIKGSKISDVIKLQDFLKKLGFLSKNIITNGYFGPSTYKAVVAFQEKYFDEVLTPINAKKGTGIVGTYTRKKLNFLLGQK